MADDTNPTSGGVVDLRQTQGGQTAGSAAGGQQDDIFAKFDIPETVKQQYPDLVPLILQTESMNDDERQYWFQILPIMTDEQVSKLREILVNEKHQLEDLDKKYNKEIKRINDKRVAEWNAAKAKEKRQKLQTLESETEKTEKQHEEELLKKLHGL